MNEYERARRRVVIEDPNADHDAFIGQEVDIDVRTAYATHDVVRRVTDQEVMDTAHPINATAIVRKDAEKTTGPDLAAFTAAFATALQQHDEEYL